MTDELPNVLIVSAAKMPEEVTVALPPMEMLAFERIEQLFSVTVVLPLSVTST